MTRDPADDLISDRRVVKVKVVLPAYNEAENLPSLLGSLAKLRGTGLDLSVLLVDDGSTDDSAAVAERNAAALPLIVLRNNVNMGLGETFARGMLAAIESTSDEDVIVCMDADDSHRPKQIPAMIEVIAAGADVVVASRYRTGARVRGVPAHRRVLSRGLSLLFQTIHPLPGLRDYSTGFRAYRKEILARALDVDGEDLFDRDGFGCMVALLLRLDAHGARCAEVPVDLRYDRKRGASKLRIGPAVAQNFRVLVGARSPSEKGRG